MLLATALMAAAAAAAPASASASAVREPAAPRLQVLMEVDAASGLSADELEATSRDVRAIWAPAAEIAILPAVAAHAIAVDTIRLLLTTRTLPGSDAGLGWIDFVNGEPQPSITVSVSTARRLLEAGTWRGQPFSSLPKQVSRTFMRRALARAIAHEIGHYLLRTTQHDRRGLMRPVFSVDEIMDGREALVRLSASEIARLRADTRLLARRAVPEG